MDSKLVKEVSSFFEVVVGDDDVIRIIPFDKNGVMMSISMYMTPVTVSVDGVVKVFLSCKDASDEIKNISGIEIEKTVIGSICKTHGRSIGPAWVSRPTVDEVMSLGDVRIASQKTRLLLSEFFEERRKRGVMKRLVKKEVKIAKEGPSSRRESVKGPFICWNRDKTPMIFDRLANAALYVEVAESTTLKALRGEGIVVAYKRDGMRVIKADDYSASIIKGREKVIHADPLRLIREHGPGDHVLLKVESKTQPHETPAPKTAPKSVPVKPVATKCKTDQEKAEMAYLELKDAKIFRYGDEVHSKSMEREVMDFILNLLLDKATTAIPIEDLSVPADEVFSFS